MDSGVALRLIILVTLLILSAFFSSAETALTTVNKLRIKSLIEEGNKRAAIVYKLIDEPSKVLCTILVGNNIVNLSASALTTSLTLELFGDTIVSIATGVLTLLILIFGEITPKTIATIHAERLSMRFAYIINFLNIIFTPITFLVSKISFALLYIFRIDPNKKSALITENELLTIVDVSHEEGVIENDEREMINNVVDFGDCRVKEVMIPSNKITAVPDDINYIELIKVFKSDEYSRLPVYSETIDNIVGIINLKDLLIKNDTNKEFNIKDYMYKPYFTYEFKKTKKLLDEMRLERISMAIVLDEYGVTAGLITVEDILEEIVGEIRDEYDKDEIDAIKKISDKEFECLGSANIDDINDALKTEFQSDDYDSIAGHVIHLLGHLPSIGENIIDDNNIKYIVLAIEKKTISKLKIILPETNEDNIE